jgi:hypothetical protein
MKMKVKVSGIVFLNRKREKNRHTITIVVWTCCFETKELSHTYIEWSNDEMRRQKKSREISNWVYHYIQVFTKCYLSLRQYFISMKQTPIQE